MDEDTALSLGDVDGDGDLDLILGDNDGTLYYYENTGTSTSPTYVARTDSDNPFDGFNLGGDSTPSLGDVDGEGDLDLVVGSDDGDGVISYLENPNALPVITQQPIPASQSLCVGGTASTTLAATGTNLSYQWYRNEKDTDEPVVGQDSTTLTLSPLQLSDAGTTSW